MTDKNNESDFNAESAEEAEDEKVNNGSSVSSNKRKAKRSRSDARKSHSSRSSLFRKSKSAQKVRERRRHRKENIDYGDGSSVDDQNSSHSAFLNEDILSDDQDSSVSDDRPTKLTRSRIRKIERRKAYSTNSSAVDSDHRKTKSEPIIITIDSDSDENVSLVSDRPSRTARIRGELIRKLSRTASAKVKSYKASDDSSSSDYEGGKVKKKSKSGKTFSSQAKRKKYLVQKLSSQRRLKLKRHSGTHVYRPFKKKKALKDFKQKIEERRRSQRTKCSVKKSSQTLIGTERRTLRSTSIEINGDSIEKDEIMADNLKADTETKLSTDIKKIPKKEPNVPQPEETEEISISNINKESTSDSKNDQNDSKDKQIQEKKVESEAKEELEQQSDVNQESLINLNKDAQSDLSIKELKNVDDIQAQNVCLEPEKAVTNRETMETASSEEGIKERIKKETPMLPPKVRKLKKKLKLKPGEKILRKRGRPRLSEMKPVKNIPILNDTIQMPFLQKTFCFSEAPKLPKCRECRIAAQRSSRTMLHAYCRFMEYRKLCYSRTGCILNAGFSEPSEATSEHLSQWLPQFGNPPKDLNFNTSKSLLEHIGDQFCDLIEQEKEALSLHIGKDSFMTWKRIVQGVREMCDVCYTTLFNIHWVCPLCGLAVCIDCYKSRKQGITVEYEDGQPKNRDQYNWLLCSLRQPHDIEALVKAQIIPGKALWIMRDLLHKARALLNIPSYCKCNPKAITSSEKRASTGICKQLMCVVSKSFTTERSSLYFNNDSNVSNGESNYDDLDFEVNGTALKWLEGDFNSLTSVRPSDDLCSSYEDFTSLGGNLLNGFNGEDSSDADREVTSFSIDEIIACVTKSHNTEDKENSGKYSLKSFSNRYPQSRSGRDPLPIRIYSKVESNLAFMNVPHSWFSNGRLLFLLQSDHPDNLALFQEQWKRGQPILVKGVDERLSKELWHPDAFCRDFGEVRNDLIDCRTGAIIKNLPMRRFWEGFESFGKRLKDDDGECMLLKLKDWPPGEDFSEMLPDRFDDLMRCLPLPEYTHRDGILNLAGRLPSWFVRPDLGPKMYNAYGSALYPAKGTTNLHLDISDAVNVMVYVGIPQDGNARLHIEEALKAIDEGGCDSLMRARVRARGAKPGALWHIYNARDADKIRDMLTKVGVERGEKVEAHHDPIHDQSWYLDAELRLRLYKEYGVEGYAIAQCLGDAVFIPAGAPHQVRNLHSCVKIAEDFVSPENIAHCFKLTQEFRNLSDTHTNHEDKLQIKNIIYHVVRDALAQLLPDGHLES